jgi:hypothetical protein
MCHAGHALGVQNSHSGYRLHVARREKRNQKKAIG